MKILIAALVLPLIFTGAVATAEYADPVIAAGKQDRLPMTEVVTPVKFCVVATYDGFVDCNQIAVDPVVWLLAGEDV